MLAADRTGDGKGARMLTITTHQGKAIEIILQTELRDPLDAGAHVRAYCHIHGSDISVPSPSTKQPAGDTVSIPVVMQRYWLLSGTLRWRAASWRHTPGDVLLHIHALACLHRSDRRSGFLP